MPGRFLFFSPFFFPSKGRVHLLTHKKVGRRFLSSWDEGFRRRYAGNALVLPLNLILLLPRRKNFLSILSSSYSCLLRIPSCPLLRGISLFFAPCSVISLHFPPRSAPSFPFVRETQLALVFQRIKFFLSPSREVFASLFPGFPH